MSLSASVRSNIHQRQAFIILSLRRGFFCVLSNHCPPVIACVFVPNHRASSTAFHLPPRPGTLSSSSLHCSPISTPDPPFPLRITSRSKALRQHTYLSHSLSSSIVAVEAILERCAPHRQRRPSIRASQSVRESAPTLYCKQAMRHQGRRATGSKYARPDRHSKIT